jgi:hypothetical protein
LHFSPLSLSLVLHTHLFAQPTPQEWVVFLSKRATLCAGKEAQGGHHMFFSLLVKLTILIIITYFSSAAFSGTLHAATLSLDDLEKLWSETQEMYEEFKDFQFSEPSTQWRTVPTEEWMNPFDSRMQKHVSGDSHWYSSECCGEQDCYGFDPSLVAKTSAGYMLTIPPYGDFPGLSVPFPFDMLQSADMPNRPHVDLNWHFCFSIEKHDVTGTYTIGYRKCSYPPLPGI